MSNNPHKLLFVGYGNMARAILRGLIESKHFTNSEIYIAGRDINKAQKLCDSFSHSKLIALQIDKDTPLNIQDYEVLLCIKPYALKEFSYIGKARIVYSVMAGIDIATLQSTLEAQNFVRIMPNVGALHRKSASCVYIHKNNAKLESNVQRLVESFGNCVIVDSENLIDASIATSGSAPAFLAIVAQSLIDSGIYNGLSYDKSKELVTQTFAGFASLLESQSPDEIKTAITSPAGTTARGLAVLEKNSVRGAFIEAGIQAVNRAKELAKK